MSVMKLLDDKHSFTDITEMSVKMSVKSVNFIVMQMRLSNLDKIFLVCFTGVFSDRLKFKLYI